jgi:hypothetical protein
MVKMMININNFWDSFLAEEPIASLREIYVPYYVIESDNLNNAIDLLAVIRMISGLVFCPKAFHGDEGRVSYFYLRPTYAVPILKVKNDDLGSAKKLVKLLDGIKAKVNLIYFNPYPGSTYKRPSREDMIAFQEYLVKHGVLCTIRDSKGIDISAACGQLKEKTAQERENEWS